MTLFTLLSPSSSLLSLVLFFLMWSRDFPAFFQERYTHKRLRNGSSPLQFNNLGCVCLCVLRKF